MPSGCRKQPIYQPSAGFLFGAKYARRIYSNKGFFSRVRAQRRSYARGLYAFPNGAATIPEFLKKCEELDLYNLAFGVIPLLPQNPEPLVLDEYAGGNLFTMVTCILKRGLNVRVILFAKN